MYSIHGPPGRFPAIAATEPDHQSKAGYFNQSAGDAVKFRGTN